MKLDTGASLSVISEITYSFFRSCKLQPSSVSLKSYTGQDIIILGEIEVNVQYAGQEAVLPLLVVKGQGASLLGRNWLEVLNLDRPSIKALHCTMKLVEMQKSKRGRKRFLSDSWTFEELTDEIKKLREFYECPFNHEGWGLH